MKKTCIQIHIEKNLALSKTYLNNCKMMKFYAKPKSVLNYHYLEVDDKGHTVLQYKYISLHLIIHRIPQKKALWYKDIIDT